MLEIKLVFEAEEFDPENPTGDIQITDGTNTIWQEHVYLDSWLDALISGLKEVEAGRSVSVDLVEEPDPLVLQPEHGGMKLTYAETTLYVNSIADFRQTLTRAGIDFLDQLHTVDEATDTELLNTIRTFVKNEVAGSRLTTPETG